MSQLVSAVFGGFQRLAGFDCVRSKLDMLDRKQNQDDIQPLRKSWLSKNKAHLNLWELEQEPNYHGNFIFELCECDDGAADLGGQAIREIVYDLGFHFLSIRSHGEAPE